MSAKHCEKVFKVYVSTLASVLHHDIIKSINNLDAPDAPSLYICRLKKYCNMLSIDPRLINSFIDLFSDLYNSYIKKENDKIKKIKEFVNSWHQINSSNNVIINNNYISLVSKVNTCAIKILLESYFISNASSHIQMYIRSHDAKYQYEVNMFERNFTNVVSNAVKLSCTKIKHNITDDCDTMVPATQYIAAMREIEKLKQENQSNLIESLKAEIEELKNEIEILKLNATPL